MIDIEEQLRRELRDIAERARPESIRPLRVPTPRRRSRTVRWLAPVAATAAVAGLIVGVTVAGHATKRLSSLPPGTPKYYVTLNRAPGGATSVVVRSSTNGAPISSVQLLGPHGQTYPLAITGASNDRAFLITIPGALEILRLAPNGHVLRLTRLPAKIWQLGGWAGASGDDVLSPDGTEVVVPINPFGCKSCAHGIAMFSVITGLTRRWLLPRGEAGFWHPINWPGYGHEVLVAGGPKSSDRMLDVTHSGDSLNASSRFISKSVIHGWGSYDGEERLLPGARTLVTGYFRVSRASRPDAPIVTGRLVETSASTGRSAQVLYSSTSQLPGHANMGCYPESVGPAQIHVLIWCNNRLGRLDGSHFTPLPGGSLGFYTAAW